jgi:hypothetical protein
MPDEHEPSRAPISTWYEPGDGEQCVVLSIGAAWGYPHRFAALSPKEARQLAEYLNQTADEADVGPRVAAVG